MNEVTEDMVLEVLQRRVPGLLPISPKELAERRTELRDRLVEINTKDLARVREADAKFDALEASAADLYVKAEKEQDRANSARFDASNERAAYFERRDAVLRELALIPCAALIEFRREVEGRLANASTWSRTWQTTKIDRQTKTYVRDGNRPSLEAYVQTLLGTKSDIDTAIFRGLDGEEAEAAIAAMRATWAPVQVGLDDYVIPAWRA